MIDLKYAVEICRIISKTPEERIPMIVSILEEAGLSPQGLDEIREWSVKKNRSAIINIEDFMGKFEDKFKFNINEDEYRVPVGDFSSFCRSLGLDTRSAKIYLVEKGIIQKFEETSQGKKKTSYSTNCRINGKTTRVIAVKKDWRIDYEGASEENNEQVTVKSEDTAKE